MREKKKEEIKNEKKNNMKGNTSQKTWREIAANIFNESEIPVGALWALVRRNTKLWSNRIVLHIDCSYCREWSMFHKCGLLAAQVVMMKWGYRFFFLSPSLVFISAGFILPIQYWMLLLIPIDCFLSEFLVAFFHKPFNEYFCAFLMHFFESIIFIFIFFLLCSFLSFCYLLTTLFDIGIDAVVVAHFFDLIVQTNVNAHMKPISLFHLAC